MLGKVSPQFDNTGKLIEVNDHHAVFLLKHRKDRNKTPFSPDENQIPQQALAKLCRITSCFPVAFPVVSVNLDEVDSTYQDRYIDKKLVEWGNLNNRVKPKERPENGYQLHFVDGGVLDNRPFSYTIREIYYRHFHRPVIRKLFYIDPSPDKFLDSTAFKKMAKPNIWESAMDSLVGLPRYESIAVDLQEIAEKNERVRRYRFLRSSVGSSAVKTLEGKKRKPSDLNIDYERQTYLRCRLIGLRDRVLPIITGLTQAKETSTPNTDQKNTLQIAADLLAYIPDPDKQSAREEYLNKKGIEIEGLDVDYMIRKHFFIQEEIVQAMESERYSQFSECLESLARYLNRMLSLLEVIKFAIDSMFLTDEIQIYFAKLIQETREINDLPELSEHDKANKKKETEIVRNKIFDYLLHLHRFLLDPDKLLGETSLENPQEDHSNPKSAKPSFFQELLGNIPTTLKDGDPDSWLPNERVTSVLHQLKKRADNLGNVDTLDKRIASNMPTIWDEKYKFRNGIIYHSILNMVDDISHQLIKHLSPDNCKPEQAALEGLKNKLLYKYCHFDFIDQKIYPYVYLSDIQSDIPLEIARISPDDSQKGFGKDKKLEERLAGLQLRAFGGFFKKSWRANDILWGRLDGLNRLVDCLLTPTTVQSFKRFKQRNHDIDNSKLVTDALPNATPEEVRAIESILDRLSCGDKLTDEEFQKFLECIVLAGQRAILTTDLKNVLNDTIEEQFRWNQQLGIPDSTDLYEVGYSSVNHQTSSPNGLKEIDELLDSLLAPKSRIGDRYQRYIEGKMKAKKNVDVKKDLDKQLEEALPLRKYLESAFSHSTVSTREDLSKELFELLRKLNAKQIKRFDKASKAFASEFILALTPSIDLLLSVSEEEMNSEASSETKKWIEKFNKQLGETACKLKDALNELKPTFYTTDGYLDKPLIPYVTGSLVDSSIQVIMNDPQKMDHYFRYQYRVGSEKVKKNIPTTILNKLLARSALVIRDILRSAPTGDVLSKTLPFQIVDRLLRTFYFWVDANDPATSFVPKVLRPLVGWIIVFVLALVGSFWVSQIPRLLLGVIITLLIA